MKPNQEICLALDTALEACSVGVAVRSCDGVTAHSRSLALGRGHAEYLMGELEALLVQAELSYADVTRLGVTVGPGSFTGLRVGLATARSLALALDVPLIGTSSLNALAQTAQENGQQGRIAVAIDARRAQIYGQIFDLKTQVLELGEAAALSAEAFASQCLDHNVSAFVGSGAALVQACDPSLAALPILENPCPDMAALARWALDQPIQKQKAAPLYLRGPDAKPQASKAIARR